jgi:hypothetical protein
MSSRIAIMGIGYTGFSPLTPEISYKEFMCKAAVRTCEDAGVNPRHDIQSDGSK